MFIKIVTEFKVDIVPGNDDIAYTEDEVKEMLAGVVEDAIKAHPDVKGDYVTDSDGFLEIEIQNIRALRG